MNFFNKTDIDNPNFPFKLTYAAKKAKDFEAARAMMDYYTSTSTLTPERFARYDENFNLHRGAWPEIENMAAQTSINVYNENISLSGGVLRHFGYVNRVSQAMVGDLIMTPTIPIFRDVSSKAINHRDRVRAGKVQEFFIDKYITPKMEEIKGRLSGQDMSNVPDLDKQLEEAIRTQLPEEILEAIDEYKTPDELLISILFDWVFKNEKVKDKIDLGADFAVAVAEEYYKIYKDRFSPKFDVLNAKFVEWGGSPDVEFCQDGEWATYTEYITFQDFIARFGTEIKLSKMDDIIELYSPIPGGEYGEILDSVDTAITDIVADNPSFQDPNSPLYIDVKTKEGQDKIKGLYQTIGSYRNNNNGIKVQYVTWRWTRPAYIIEDESGKERIVDEHYVKNPARGDKKAKKVLIPQVWHGYIVGGIHYVGIEPVEYQYDNLLNPFKPKLTIHGVRYNMYMNNVKKNTSVIDLGKPINFRINMIMKKMEEYESTDIGKLLFLTSDVKPVGMTWGQWYSSLFTTKVVLLSKKYEGMQANDKLPVYVQDMSRTADIKDQIEKLSFFEHKLVLAMYYNPAKFGDIGQYATNENTQMSISGVDRQMVRFVNKRRMLKQDMLTSLCNVTISSFKDNEYMKELLLDDLQKAYYDLNMEPFSASSIALFLVDDFEEGRKIEGMRQLALSIIQNGGSARDIARIFSSDSMAQIEEVLDKSDKKKQKDIEMQRQHEQGLADKQMETAKMQMELKQQFDAAEAERDRQVKIRLAEINAQFMANASDIDKNKMNDALQKAVLEIQSKERMQERELEVEREKISKT